MALAVALSGVWVSGLATALIRSGSPLVAFQWAGKARPSILEWDRAAQLMRDRPELAEAVRTYEAHVPDTTTVASMLQPDSFEYVLLGPRLHRQVVPFGDRGLEWAHQEGAAFLVFSDQRLAPTTRDLHLGEDWWLRTVLTPSSRMSSDRP